MLQYLVILLDDTSTSFCHYENSMKERCLIPLEILKLGIRFGMKENLMIQFVYPDYELPTDYKSAIESIDHSKIVSYSCVDKQAVEEADALIIENWAEIKTDNLNKNKCYVFRTTKNELFGKHLLLNDAISIAARLNVVITDIHTFNHDDFEYYKQILLCMSDHIEQLYVNGMSPQLNLLTDRMLLSQMNNCGAGDTTITLAPNGKFYVCPAFYYEDTDNSVGDIEHGLDIKNKQLYRLKYAPICRHCDAWQCKRCIWLNRKTTLEVNTPSHEQCVVAHLERNASRELLHSIRKHGTFLPEQEEIKELDYLDPFDIRDTWQ